MSAYRQIAMLDDPPSSLIWSHRLFMWSLGHVLAALAQIEINPEFKP